MAQRSFNCFILPTELAEILKSAQEVYDFKLLGGVGNKAELVDLDFEEGLKSVEFLDFKLSIVGTETTSTESWWRGDLSFPNISNVFGYLEVMQLCLNESIPESEIEPRLLFKYIKKHILKNSKLFDDLCMVPSGAKCRPAVRMSVGARTA